MANQKKNCTVLFSDLFNRSIDKNFRYFSLQRDAQIFTPPRLALLRVYCIVLVINGFLFRCVKKSKKKRREHYSGDTDAISDEPTVYLKHTHTHTNMRLCEIVFKFDCVLNAFNAYVGSIGVVCVCEYECFSICFKKNGRYFRHEMK